MIAGKGDPFWPAPGQGDEAVVKYCFGCQVRTECEDKANRLKVESGIWGGKQRRKT